MVVNLVSLSNLNELYQRKGKIMKRWAIKKDDGPKETRPYSQKTFCAFKLAAKTEGKNDGICSGEKLILDSIWFVFANGTIISI